MPKPASPGPIDVPSRNVRVGPPDITLPKSDPNANHELSGLVYRKSISAVVASCVQRPSGPRFPLGHRLSIPTEPLGSFRRTLVNIALPIRLSERSEPNRLIKKFVGGATRPELLIPLSLYIRVALSGAVTESRIATFNLLPMRPVSFAAPQIWVPALPGESKTVVPVRVGSGIAAPILRE